MVRLEVPGTAAHGATPWLGDNAVLRAVDIFRRIETLPFAGESAPLFERPSINLGRIQGGDAVNKVPDPCRMDVDLRYLPGQYPEEVLRQVRSLDPRATVEVLLERPPADVPPDHPWCRRCWRRRAATSPRPRRSGRDGASDAVAFLEVGRARGGVRPPRRRAPRAGGVRGDRQPAPLPPRAGGVRPPRGAAGRARRRAGGGRVSPPRRDEPPHRKARYWRVPRRRSRVWLAIAGWTLWGIIGLVVAVAAGAYITLDDTLRRRRPEHARGTGRPRGHPARPARASRRTSS